MFPYRFEGPIERHVIEAKASDRALAYFVVWLPEALHADLPQKGNPKLRVAGEIAEMPFEGAWQAWRGRRYLMVPRAIMDERGLSLGDEVELRFAVADQDAVDVPPALAALLREDGMRGGWERLTVGRRRALAHHVGSAKRDETRARRLAEVEAALDPAREVPKALRRMLGV